MIRVAEQRLTPACLIGMVSPADIYEYGQKKWPGHDFWKETLLLTFLFFSYFNWSVLLVFGAPWDRRSPAALGLKKADVPEAETTPLSAAGILCSLGKWKHTNVEENCPY